MQLKTDLEKNMPALFDKYKPQAVVDFGTAAGGTAVLYYQFMSKYCQPKILSLDITDADYKQAESFHKDFKTADKVQLIFGKSSLDCREQVESFLKGRMPGQKVMLSFDDDHHYEHTFQELELYGPLLQSGDVILMQDTWNQGLRGHETSPMLAVYRFLKAHPEFKIDEEFNKQMQLPCNFVYGVLVKS